MLQKNNTSHRLLRAVIILLLFPANVFGNIVITQIMYDTPLNEVITQPPYSNGEFVELYNASPLTVDMSGWHLCGGGKTEIYAFPDGTTVPAEGYVVVAYRHKNTPLFALDSLYQDVPAESDVFRILYQRDIILSNAGEDIVLRNAEGVAVDSIFYDGTSNKRKVHRLSADNTDSIGNADSARTSVCRTIQRIRVGTDNRGGILPDNTHWETKPVTFAQAGTNLTTLLPAGFFEWKDPAVADYSDNYILSVHPLDATGNVTVNGSNVYVGCGARAQVAYTSYDALGRPVRQVGRRATPDCKDLVTHTEYLPGKTGQWLPVPVENGMEATTGELQTIATDYYNDAAPFTTLTKEQTSSARPLSLLQTGETWQTHAATAAYGVNQANEVRRFRVTTEGIEQDGYYPAATLRTQTHTDADGRSVVTYTDAAGNAVLLRMADGALTCRVYDDMDRLRYVLPPAVMTQLPQGTINANDSILRLYAYTYRYDRRGNLIYKRLPGCEPVYMVYDRTGRAVLSQDGNQRARGDYWTVFKYDSVGRLAYTGEVLADGETHEEKIRKFADWKVMETFAANGQSRPMENTGYSRNFYHFQPTKLLTVSYYDNYDFLQLLPADTLQALTYEENTLYGTRYENTTGLLTGTRVYSLEDSVCTITAYYYDLEGRVIQQRTVTHTGTCETTHTAYHFDGTVSRTLHEQGDITEHYLYTYDHAGRPKRTLYTLDEQPTVVLTDNHYDATGKLTEKRRHNGQDTIRYQYDLRGALTQLSSGDFSERLFYADSLPNGATANYNGNIAAIHLTNGTTTQQWQYTYDNRNRLMQSNLMKDNKKQTSEQFTYDDMGNILFLRRYNDNVLIDELDYYYNGNQLLHSIDYAGSQDRYDINEYNSEEEATTANVSRYDANGNLIFDADRQICAIRYNLLNLPDTIQFMNGNQIVNKYDAMGRKLRSTSCTLVEPLATPATGVLQLEYTSKNVKKTVTTYNGNLQTTSTWPLKGPQGRQYTTIIYNSEGYVKKSAATIISAKNAKYTYSYYRRDHLGNNVALWDATNDTTVQRTFYYASGLPMSCSTGQSAQSRKYNGKEYVEDHGFDVYDYGFRGYYATIGRFTSIDPLTEQTPWQSPYVYANNNFVNNIDYWGLAAGASGSGGVYTTSDPDKIAALLEHLSKNNSLDGFDLSDWESGFGSAKWWIDETNGTFSFTYVTNGGGGGGIMNGGTRIDDWDIINVTYSLSSAHASSILGDMAYRSETESNLLATIGLVYGGLSNGIGMAGNLTCNELYWFGKNGKFYTRGLRHKQGGWAYSYKVVRQQPKVQKLKNIGKRLGYINLIAEGVNIGINKELQTSNLINISLTIASFTGVGALVAAGYFTIDTSVLIATGNSLNDHINNLIGPILQW